MIMLLGSLFFFLLIGVPVGFAIGLSVLLFIMIDPIQSVDVIIPSMVAGVDSFPLLAIPLFIFAGVLMEKGSTPRLTRLADSIVGAIKGGFGVVAVVASAFFGAVSGSGIASAAAIGSIMGPEMTKRNYAKGYSASVITASSGLGTLIPPSITLVVFGAVSGTSIGKLLIAGVVPGIITTVLLSICTILLARKLNYQGSSSDFSFKQFFISFKEAILPLLTPIIIIGGIFSGIFTPTESAAVAVVYAFILSFFVYKELRIKDIPKVLKSTVITSSSILFIVAATGPFGWVITTENIPQMISNTLLTFFENPIFITIIILLLIVVLGTFMEPTAIIIITTPIFFPILTSIGMDPLVYGIILTICLIIGGMTPPVAINLFVASNALGIQIQETFRYLWPFIITVVLSLILHLIFPVFSTWLPNLLL